MRSFRKIRKQMGSAEVLGFWCGDLRARDYLEDQGVDVRIILKWIFKKWGGGDLDWIDMVQDRDRWRVLVNTVMNIRLP
jgi:hypothetical protein